MNISGLIPTGCRRAAMVVGLAGCLITPASVQAVTITPGNTLGAGEGPFAATRFRELGSIGTNGNDQELYVGEPDLGVGSNRSGLNLQWSAGANDFTIDYVDATQTLTTTITNGAGGSPYSTSYVLGSANPGYNTIVLQVVNRTAGSQVTVTDLVAAGDVVGDFTPASNSGFVEWTITDLNLATDFSISGKMNLFGLFSGSAEANKVEIGLATPEPASALLLGSASLVALARRRRDR